MSSSELGTAGAPLARSVDGETMRRLVATAPVARLATVSGDGRPHLVPVTFALDGDRIVTAVDGKPKTTRRLRRLRNIAENPLVSLLVDHYEDDWSRLWWVRVDGRAALRYDRETLAHARRLLAAKYRHYIEQPPDGPVVVVLAERWRGWFPAA